jgi:hypothetical protein
VPAGPLRGGTAADLGEYSPKTDADIAAAMIAQTAKAAAEVEACLDVAYNGAARPLEIVAYLGGMPIPGEPPEPAEGEKRKLPPPPKPEQGGASPCWVPAET